MFQPAKTKYRKWHRRRNTEGGVATSGNQISFGTMGLKCMSGGEITSRQLEAARKAIAHALKRGGKIWIRIFPHQPITRKAAEVPMGSGKGGVEFYVSQVKRGHIIVELGGVSDEIGRGALALARSKLPVRSRIVLSHT